MPVKKVGNENPTKANVLAMRSNNEYGRDRRVDADRQRDHQREYLRGADDRQRDRHALQNQRIDVDAADEGVAPVALQHRSEPAKVALPHRVIETEFGAQHLAHFGRHCGVGRKLLERVARRQREHGEQHDADAEHARHHDQHAPQDVGTQGRPREAGESRAGACDAPARVSQIPASRYQSFRFQKSLSQPDNGACNLVDTAATRGR